MKPRSLLLLAALLPGAATADGMPIQDGRFVGPVTVITLTVEQKKQMAANRERVERWKQNPKAEFGEPIPRILLTLEQQAKLKKDTGKTASLFFFYETRLGENDCTCHAANNALRFSETEAEIPHAYVMPDKAAKEMDASANGEGS